MENMRLNWLSIIWEYNSLQTLPFSRDIFAICIIFFQCTYFLKHKKPGYFLKIQKNKNENKKYIFFVWGLSKMKILLNFYLFTEFRRFCQNWADSFFTVKKAGYFWSFGKILQSKICCRSTIIQKLEVLL